VESEAAARGYPPARRLRQQRARAAGLASGRKRRELGDRAVTRRARQRELALNFRVKLIDRAEFDRLDFARRLRAGIEPNERGTETLWQEYLSCARAYRAQGQGFFTTNGQRAEALRKAGRPRCERTVRRAHAALSEMGLLRRFHDRRGGWRAGRKDRLRIQFAPSYVQPPSAAPTTTASQSCVGARNGLDCAAGGRRERTARARPPDGGGEGGRQAAGNGSDDREGAIAAVAFLQLQLELPSHRRSGAANTATLEEKLREWRARL
jgi:hypothetical protein